MKRELSFPDFTVSVERKDNKHTYIRIRPDGQVVVTCPRRTTDRELRYLIEERYHWIVTHRDEVLRRQAAQRTASAAGRQSAPLWGRQYPLRLEERSGRYTAAVEGEELVLRGPVLDGETQTQLLNALYRAELNAAVPPLLERAEAATGLHPSEWRLREMHTRWGSCNVQKRRIWLSLNLAKFPPQCLYVVLIHELTHLLERGHNARFYALMDRFEPRWREADALLKAGGPTAGQDG